MTNILYVIIALIVFSVLVLVHEFGHYFVAKKNGILVKEFAIGMGPTVVSTKKGDTVYSIRLLPLGGFCSMLGEDEANNDPRSFNSKTPLQRIAVVVMGPVMNFVFAFFIVFFISATATGVIFPTVVNVLEGTNAAEKGLEVGDTIYSVNGERIGTYQDLFLALDGCNGETLDVVVTRDGKKIAMEIEPSISEQNRWIIGFTPLVKSGLFSEAIEGYDKVTLAETVKDT
ncbi:MAG: site-2 protease family protein, partial [Anaerotignaceae bacterium]